MSGRELNNAAQNGDIETIRRLLQERVDPNDKDWVCIPSM